MGVYFYNNQTIGLTDNPVNPVNPVKPIRMPLPRQLPSKVGVLC